MQNSFINPRQKDDLFSPWNVDSQMELIAINSVIYQSSEQQKKRHSSLRAKKISKQFVIAEQEDEKMKTLLNIGKKEREKKIQHLKKYVDKKKQSNLNIESQLPQGFIQFKLPPINSRKRTLNQKQNQKKMSSNNLEQFVVGFDQQDNQEQQIFKKYGEHKKKQKGINGQRSLSLGCQSISLLIAKNELQQNYDTLETPRARLKKNSDNVCADLNLIGKKYSYEIKSEKSHKTNNISYIPTQPKITPHYMLFGRNKEDVLKSVLQQLHYKIKQYS